MGHAQASALFHGPWSGPFSMSVEETIFCEKISHPRMPLWFWWEAGAAYLL